MKSPEYDVIVPVSRRQRAMMSGHKLFPVEELNPEMMLWCFGNRQEPRSGNSRWPRSVVFAAEFELFQVGVSRRDADCTSLAPGLLDGSSFDFHMPPRGGANNGVSQFVKAHTTEQRRWHSVNRHIQCCESSRDARGTLSRVIFVVLR